MAFGLQWIHRVKIFHPDEVSMSAEDFGLTTRSVAELALVVSRASDSVLDGNAIPTTAELRSFWQSSRKLQRRWMKTIDDGSTAGSLDIDFLEQIAPRLFVSEMLVRTWSTVLASLDLKRGTEDLTTVARNVVNGLMQIRHRVLSELLTIPESDHDRVMNIDRLRRRCDRWTDLLLGRLAIEHGCFEFAFDPQRARDFGEEAQIDDSGTGLPANEHLISAGLRMTFLQHLPAEALLEPEFASLMKSILSCITPKSLHRDGAFRSLLQLRIAAMEHRCELKN